MTNTRLHDLLGKVRNRHFLLVDVMILLCTPALALMLRVDSLALMRYAEPLVGATIMFLVFKLVIFRLCGLYSQYWHYASIHELGLIARGGVLALCFQVLGVAMLNGSGLVPVIPRSLPVIETLIAMPAIITVRYSVRLIHLFSQHTGQQAAPKRVLIVGAGRAGVMFTQEIHGAKHLGMLALGFVDDNLQKHHMTIRGLRIFGGRAEIPRLVQQLRIDEVIIAMPTAPGKEIREIVAICERAGVPTRMIPNIQEIMGGKLSVSNLRHVQIEDLLRRAPVQTDTTAVYELLRGKRVLVTGGGGSIGSELCRQILRCEPAELIVLGHGENSVFEIQNELLRYLANASDLLVRPTLTPVIADIRFPERIMAVFHTYQPQLVFHAAAHKHVPLMEANPCEAVTNNILGTENLLKAAQAVDVERFVMISSDKAVNPTSVMGASKRAAELLVRRAAQQSCRPYVAVRFGNVLGSRGSVVLTFRQQIAAGGPITITHPEMTRYFMTIPEAVQLVLQAGELGGGGEIFMLDMGEPIKIVDLARDMIELSGLKEGRDIDIVFTGLRPGEKLFEELFGNGEAYGATRHEKIFIAANATNFVPSKLEESIGDLARAAQLCHNQEIIDLLQGLIPEYEPHYAAPITSSTNDEPLIEVAQGDLRHGSLTIKKAY